MPRKQIEIPGLERPTDKRLDELMENLDEIRTEIARLKREELEAKESIMARMNLRKLRHYANASLRARIDETRKLKIESEADRKGNGEMALSVEDR
jgi:tRNA(Ser,Leu) C12 N-acetylase TAN1